jgi:hypothetical protein
MGWRNGKDCAMEHERKQRHWEDGRPEEVSPALWQVLDEWEAPRPDSGFDQRVLARIREEHSRESVMAPAAWLHRLQEWSRGTSRWGFATAFAVLLAAALLLWSPAGIEFEDTDAPLAEFSIQQAEDALEDLRMLEELFAGYNVEENQNNRL